MSLALVLPDRDCRTKCRLRPPSENLLNVGCLKCNRCSFADQDISIDLYQPEHGWYTPVDVTNIGAPIGTVSHFYEYRTALCVALQTDPTNPKYFIGTLQKTTDEPLHEPCPICMMVFKERSLR